MRTVPTVRLAFLAGVMFVAPAFAAGGDVVIKLATTPGDASITVSAVPGHAFAATFKDGDHTVEVSGSVKPVENGVYRVQVKFAERKDGTRSIDTTITAKPGEAIKIAGSGEGAAERATTLTVTEAK